MKIVRNGFKNERLGFELDVYIVEGKEWFKAQDISKYLNYTQASDMLRNIDSIEENTTKHNMLCGNGNCSDVRFINEFALYECILKIRNSETDDVKKDRYNKARAFQKWVYEEVLPSLRKTNSYVDEEYITKEQYEALRETLMIVCESGKIGLPKASMKIFGNKDELNKRFVNLKLIDRVNCTWRDDFTCKDKKSGEDYPVFVCDMKGNYEDGIVSKTLQVSLTNYGFVYFKELFKHNPNLGL